MAMSQEHLNILSSSDNSAKIALLQTFVKSSPPIDDDAIIQKVTTLTQDADMALRFWSKKVLAKISPPQLLSEVSSNSTPYSAPETKAISIDLLLKKLESTGESSFVSLDVIQKICESKDIRALQPLIEYLNRCSDPIQISFLTKNIGICFPSEELLPLLVPYLKHEDDRIVANTVEGIEATGSSKAVVIFAQMLEHRSNRVRANAAKALSKSNPEQTNIILTRMLSMQDKPHFIISACHAIGTLKAKSFLPALKNLLHEDLLFCDSLKAIEAIGGSDAIIILMESLNEIHAEEEKAEINTVLSKLKNSTSNPQSFKLSNKPLNKMQASKSYTPPESIWTNIQGILLSGWNSLTPLITTFSKKLISSISNAASSNTPKKQSINTEVVTTPNGQQPKSPSPQVQLDMNTQPIAASPVCMVSQPIPVIQPVIQSAAPPTRNPFCCPQCGQMDMARTIRALLGSELVLTTSNITGSMSHTGISKSMQTSAYTVGFSFLSAQSKGIQVSAIATKLRPPDPKPPIFHCSLTVGYGTVLLYGWKKFLTINTFLLLVPIIFVISKPRPESLTIFAACLLFYLFLWIPVIFLSRRAKKEQYWWNLEEKARNAYTVKCKQYEAEYNCAMENWGKAIYCSRCDIVYLGENASGAFPDQLCAYLKFPPFKEYTIDEVLLLREAENA